MNWEIIIASSLIILVMTLLLWNILPGFLREVKHELWRIDLMKCPDCPEERLSRAIKEILETNITLHSVRGGEGVWQITGFQLITNKILALIEDNGYVYVGKFDHIIRKP